MKGKKKNYDKKIYSKKNGQNKSTLNKRSMKDERYGITAMKYYNSLNIKENEELKADSNNIKSSSVNLCKSVFVVIENLSPEILEKYITINKNLEKKSKKLEKPKQSSISEKLPSKKIQSNDNVSYIFDTKNEVDNTSLNLTNNINVNDKSNNKRKNDDQRRNKEKILKSVQPSIILNKESVIKAQRKLESVLSSGDIIDNNKCEQNHYACNNTKFVNSLPKINDQLSPAKEKMKNKKFTLEWECKRRCILSIKSINASNVLKNEGKRTSKSCIEDITQTTFLKNLELTDNKVTTSNLNLHAQYANITHTKVILTKLENMDDNIYIDNWKKKCAQQALLSKNLEPAIVHEDVSINTLATEIIDSSHKNVTKDSDSHINKANGLNLCTLQSKYEQHKIPKVLLVKLEKLGDSCKVQKSISTIKHSTTQCIDRFKLNSNHSSNVFSCNNKVNGATNEYHYSNSSTIQLEENSSCISKMSRMCSESRENLENLEIYKPSISEIEERSALSKIPQEESFSIAKSIFATILQKCLKRVSEKSSTKEVVSNEISKSNSKLKKTQTLPSVITKQNNSSKPNNATLKYTNEINCENIQILQNNETTIIDNNEQSVLDIHKKLSYRENHHSDVIKKADSIIKLPENVQTKQINNKTIISKQQINISQLNITTLDYPLYYECFFCKSYFKDYRIFQSHVKKCSLRSQKMNNRDNTNVIHNSFKDNENIPKTPKCNDTSELSSQHKSFALDSNSTESSKYSNISSLSTISKGKTKKRYHENKDKDELPQRKIFKNDNNNSLRCKVCSKLFDSLISLSNHIYSHTKEKKLQKTYKRNRKNQNSKYINVSSSDDEITSIVTTDSNKKTQECIEESSNTLPVNSTTVRSLQSSLENKKDESTINKITPMEEMRLQKNMSAENILEILTTELNKNELIKNSKINEKTSFKFCACHEKNFKKETSMKLVLFCNICNVLYQNMDCFKAHLENAELYMCNGTKLTRKISKLYCSICTKILCEAKEMRKHMESHLIFFKSIKLFCHICKIRFIGMGPIFLKHWSHHDIDVFYKASVSHFPALSIVDPTSKEWLIISSDEFKYLIVTEHFCSNCNVQCFSTNQLKDHMSSCTNKVATNLPSISLPQDCRNSDVQSELDVSVDIDKITFPNKFSSEKHTASNKNNLKLENITEMFACKICSNTFESLDKLMIHWRNHESPPNLTCNQCTQNFNNFIMYIEHLNYCIKTVNLVDDSLSEDTHCKQEFICKICNIVFDSRRALFQHNTMLKKNFSNLNTVDSNNSTFKISHCSINQIKQNNRVTLINKRISEVPESQNFIVNQLIDSPTTSSSAKIEEIVSDDVCLNNHSIIDQDLENLSSISDVVTDNLNIAQINNIIGNSRPSVVKNKTGENENACKINNNLNKNDSREDLNDKNTIIVNSKQKTVLDTNTPSFKTININENEDDIVLIKSEIPRENEKSAHKNSWEAVEPTTNLQLNNSTKISEESIKPKKYLRVRNISELIDQSSRYNMFNNQDESISTSMSSPMNINLSNEEQTKRINVESHQITKSSNFQQKSVTMSSDSSSHKIIITSIEKQEVVRSFSEQENQKQCLFLSSATSSTLPSTSASTSRSAFTSALASTSRSFRSVLKSTQTSVSVQQSAKIVSPQLTEIRKSLLPETTVIKKSVLAVPIPSPTSQSAQTALSIQIPSYITSCTTQPQISNIQYPSIRPDGNSQWTIDSERSVNHTYAETNNNCKTYNEQQSQNITNNKLLINLLPSSSRYSVTSNYGNNTFIIQEKNNELCKTASTSTAFTSIASTSTVSMFTATTHNIHNLNEVHNNLSNKVTKVNSVDIRPQNRTELHMNKKISIPVSSNEYYNYNTSSAEYLSTNNKNLTECNIENNNMPNIMGDMQNQPNNLSQVTTSYRPSAISEFEILLQQFPHIRFQLVCNYCPNSIIRFTRQEYDIHINSQHNFICNICNCRYYTSDDLKNHQLKQHNVDFSNIF